MEFVVDTVGDITMPDGTTCKGVILTVPDSATPQEQDDSMRAAGRLWCDRVIISPASTHAEATS